MTREAGSRSAVNRETGEIVQLELLEGETLHELRKPPQPVRYDWRPHPGRHVNVAKQLMALVWHRDSGYSQNDRDILGFYLAHSPEGAAPLRMTYKEISSDLGVRQDTVAKSVKRLSTGGLLLEAERYGRIRFFRINPRAAFDGPAAAQVQATRDARHPVVPAPRTTTRRRAS